MVYDVILHLSGRYGYISVPAAEIAGSGLYYSVSDAVLRIRGADALHGNLFARVSDTELEGDHIELKRDQSNFNTARATYIDTSGEYRVDFCTDQLRTLFSVPPNRLLVQLGELEAVQQRTFICSCEHAPFHIADPGGQLLPSASLLLSDLAEKHVYDTERRRLLVTLSTSPFIDWVAAAVLVDSNSRIMKFRTVTHPQHMFRVCRHKFAELFPGDVRVIYAAVTAAGKE